MGKFLKTRLTGEAGFTLVELMITGAIVSLGVLGVGTIIANTYQVNQEIKVRSSLSQLRANLYSALQRDGSWAWTYNSQKNAGQPFNCIVSGSCTTFPNFVIYDSYGSEILNAPVTYFSLTGDRSTPPGTPGTPSQAYPVQVLLSWNVIKQGGTSGTALPGYFQGSVVVTDMIAITVKFQILPAYQAALYQQLPTLQQLNLDALGFTILRPVQ